MTEGAAQGEGGDLVEVRLVGLPLAVRDAAERHMEALNREFELIRRRHDGADTIPHRLQHVVDELSGRYGSFADEPRQALADAAARGDAQIDLCYRVPSAAGEAARRLGDLLDEAEAYCADGEHLLTLVTSPEVRRYRHWFLGEFERQIAGEPPTSWEDHQEDLDPPEALGSDVDGTWATTGGDGSLPEGWELTVTADGGARLAVVGPLDLVSAPALRDVLIEVVADTSRVAVDLSGCDFLDSVGLSVLLAAIARAQEQQATVTFRLSEATDRVLALSGVLERLDVEA